jgi:hypothetical protein
VIAIFTGDTFPINPDEIQHVSLTRLCAGGVRLFDGLALDAATVRLTALLPGVPGLESPGTSDARLT